MQLRNWIALASVGTLLVLAPAARPASFDYLYIEANEGGSSGGHTAIRFGERIYHFQNRAGLLVLDRQSTPDFFHAYALLNNRAIHSSRVDVSNPARALLLESFNRRHHAQEQQLDVLEALREDRSLLEAFRDEEPVRIPGLGFFDLERRGSNTAQNLLAEIVGRYGADFASRRRAELQIELARAAASDPSGWPLVLPRDRHDRPPFVTPFARRYLGVAAGFGALDVLEQGAPLAPDAMLRPEAEVWELTPQELERAGSAYRDLTDQLVRLAGSERSDWGESFLVGLARLEALDRALAQGRLILLDTLPPDARRLEYRHIESRLDLVADMIRAGHAQLAAARSDWLAAEAASERDWTRLEDAGNRVHELESAVRERRDLRLARGTRIPARPGSLSRDLASTPHEQLPAALESVKAREKNYERALDALYQYHLIAQNCVSELFGIIDDAFGGDPAASVAALGGIVDGHRRGTFIPFVSARAVDREYRVVSQATLPSYRDQRLAEMRRDESPLLVALRESNTLTAHSYRRGTRDSFFLFFTDDAFLLRPLLGVFNLAAGIGESVFGLGRLPFDRGDTLLSGLEGALVSLPELVFWNIRKGTNDWVPSAEPPASRLRKNPGSLLVGGVDVDR